MLVNTLDQLTEAALKDPGAASWLPVRALAAVGYLLTATICRPKGKYSRAKAQLTSAIGHLHLAAREAKLDIRVRVLYSSSAKNDTLIAGV